jgi:hypothetical protein
MPGSSGGQRSWPRLGELLRSGWVLRDLPRKKGRGWLGLVAVSRSRKQGRKRWHPYRRMVKTEVWTKCTGEVFFYSCEHRDRRDGSGWRLVLSRARTARVRMHRRRHAARRTAAGDLRGDEAEGVCSYVVGSGALDRGWSWTGPHGAHGRASARCLLGVGLGSWRLDGHTRCQQGRRKERHCARLCCRVLGSGIVAAQRP